MSILFKAQQLIGDDNQHDPAGLKKIITENWTNGVIVNFYKKDGVLRKMHVKLNADLLVSKSTDDNPTPGLETRRATNKTLGNMVVTEWLPETDSWQVRTLPLKRIVSIESI